MIAAALLVFLLAGYLAFRNLGAHSISQRSDEVIYARVIESITIDGKLLFPTHGDIPFYNKPPFKLWVDAVAVSILGENNFGFRAVSALSGIALVLLTMVAGAVLFRSPVAGVFAGFLLLGFSEFTVSPHGMRRAVLDPFLSVLCGAAVLSGYRAISGVGSSGRYWIVCGLLCAVSILTKSVAGFFPWAVLAAFALTAAESRAAIREQKKWIALALAVTVLLPALYYGALFFEAPKSLGVVLGWEIVHRATQGFTGHAVGEPFFYLTYFLTGKMGPPFLVLVGVVVAALRWKVAQNRIVLCWAVVPVLLYSAAESKVPWYLMPAFPALALLAALGVVRIPEYLCARFVGAKRWGALAVFCIVMGAAISPVAARILRCADIVESQVERIPLDILSEDLERSPGIPIYLVGKPLSRRANPVRGKFNVEGIYLSKFWTRAVKIDRWSAPENPVPTGAVVIAHADDPSVPSTFPRYMELAPIPPREEALVVYKAP